MDQTADKFPIWYRTYVLAVLLLVCISNLSTRNQPSYLITIPVPQCEDLCRGVTVYPTCNVKLPTEPPKTKKELCNACRSQTLSWSSANPKRPPIEELPPFDKQAVTVQLGAQPLSLKVRRDAVFLGLEAEEQDPWKVVKVSSSSWEVEPEDMDAIAGYYNMSDGTCLWYWEYGLLIGYGFALIYAAGTLPAGYLCDRRSRIAIVALALFVCSICTSMQAAAHSFWMLLLWRAGIGLAQAFSAPAAVSLTIEYFSSSERQRELALAVVTMVGPQLGAGCASFSIIFAEMIGWRWVVLITGIAGILLSVLVLATVKEPERTEWSAPCELSLVADEVFEKSRVARMLTAAVTAKMFAAYSLAAFLPIWYARRGLEGYTSTTYAYWNALAVSLSGVLSALVGSVLGQVFGHRDAACFLGLGGALAAVPLTFLTILSSRFETSLLSYFILQVVGECWFGPSMALLQLAVKRSVRGQATSLVLVVATLGGNLGPALVGFCDPGSSQIGIHILWTCVSAQILAALSFFWTAREISLDPVGVSLGMSPAYVDRTVKAP